MDGGVGFLLKFQLLSNQFHYYGQLLWSMAECWNKRVYFSRYLLSHFFSINKLPSPPKGSSRAGNFTLELSLSSNRRIFLKNQLKIMAARIQIEQPVK